MRGVGGGGEAGGSLFSSASGNTCILFCLQGARCQNVNFQSGWSLTVSCNARPALTTSQQFHMMRHSAQAFFSNATSCIINSPVESVT